MGFPNKFINYIAFDKDKNPRDKTESIFALCKVLDTGYKPKNESRLITTRDAIKNHSETKRFSIKFGISKLRGSLKSMEECYNKYLLEEVNREINDVNKKINTDDQQQKPGNECNKNKKKINTDDQQQKLGNKCNKAKFDALVKKARKNNKTFMIARARKIEKRSKNNKNNYKSSLEKEQKLLNNLKIIPQQQYPSILYNLIEQSNDASTSLKNKIIERSVNKIIELIKNDYNTNEKLNNLLEHREMGDFLPDNQINKIINAIETRLNTLIGDITQIDISEKDSINEKINSLKELCKTIEQTTAFSYKNNSQKLIHQENYFSILKESIDKCDKISNCYKALTGLVSPVSKEQVDNIKKEYSELLQNQWKSTLEKLDKQREERKKTYAKNKEIMTKLGKLRRLFEESSEPEKDKEKFKSILEEAKKDNIKFEFDMLKKLYFKLWNYDKESDFRALQFFEDCKISIDDVRL